jgi:hypothetical protein
MLILCGISLRYKPLQQLVASPVSLAVILQTGFLHFVVAVAYLLLLPMLLLDSGCRNACLGKLIVLFEKLPVYFVADV